jgi:hypothetical protein
MRAYLLTRELFPHHSACIASTLFVFLGCFGGTLGCALSWTIFTDLLSRRSFLVEGPANTLGVASN